jgi:hypothetical protein
MALPQFMKLKLGGNDVAPEIDYDNTMTTMGGENVEDHFQVLEFEAQVSVGVAGSSNLGSQAQAGRRHTPWRIRFLVGKGFPLIFEGLRLTQEVEIDVKLFVEHPTTGQTELLHTATIRRGRIVDLRLVAPNTLNPETSNLPIWAEMMVVGHTIGHVSALGTEGNDAHEVRGATG